MVYKKSTRLKEITLDKLNRLYLATVDYIE